MAAVVICEESGKHCYRSVEHARRVMRGLSASLRCYVCKFCSTWHLTKKSGR